MLELANLTYRSAEPEDKKFLFELYCSTRTAELNTWGWDNQQQEAFLKMQFQAQQSSYQQQFPDCNYQIVSLDNQAVGAMLVIRNEAEIRLADIALLPKYRDRGIGSFLIQNLFKEAAQTGKPVRLQVIKFNRAYRLYQRLGFSKVRDNGIHFLLEWLPSDAAQVIK